MQRGWAARHRAQLSACDFRDHHDGDLTLFKRLTLAIRDSVIEDVFYPIFPPDEQARQVLAWLQSRLFPPSSRW